MTNKKSLSERDICTKYINPALEKSGWDIQAQVREEVSFTDGRIYVKGNLSTRGKRNRADYILYYKPNIPIAIIEVKVKKLLVIFGQLETQIISNQSHAEQLMQVVLKEEFQQNDTEVQEKEYAS